MLRVIFSGLIQLTAPRSAPYGQRYLHQKFLRKIDKIISTMIAQIANVVMCAKNMNILISATLL